MLFVIDANGVPSVARMVKLRRQHRAEREHHAAGERSHVHRSGNGQRRRERVRCRRHGSPRSSSSTARPISARTPPLRSPTAGLASAGRHVLDHRARDRQPRRDYDERLRGTITVNAEHRAEREPHRRRPTGASYLAPATIPIAASASDRRRRHRGRVLQRHRRSSARTRARRTPTTGPTCPPARYSITARATDSLGAQTTSARTDGRRSTAIQRRTAQRVDHVTGQRRTSFPLERPTITIDATASDADGVDRPRGVLPQRRRHAPGLRHERAVLLPVEGSRRPARTCCGRRPMTTRGAVTTSAAVSVTARAR